LNVDHETLFRPITINQLTLQNRYVQGPMAAHAPQHDGRPSAETFAFFERRARSGVGLVIVGGAYCTQWGWEGASNTRYWIRLDRDDYAADLAKLAETAHRNNVPIFAELNVGDGAVGKPGPDFIAASAVALEIPEAALKAILPVPGGVRKSAPRAATRDEIARLEDETAQSALRVKKAGFDGVELGAQMSYFLASFLSSRTNLRDDEYGGSTENRARIIINIVRKIRGLVGGDYPIGVRMLANEHVEGGQEAAEYAALARLFEAASVDYIALTEGGHEAVDMGATGDASIVRHGEAQVFKQHISIPIMLQGVHDPDLAASIVRAGHADLILLGRPLLVDPDYVNKLRQGKAVDIVRCDKNNECLRRLMVGLSIRCPRNPTFGREATVANRPKQIASHVAEWATLKAVSSPTLMKLASKVVGK
jgi:2,4-dienoyl-CoA reductase (NADPH2)